MSVTPGAGVEDIASVCDFIVALSKRDGWIYTESWSGSESPTWDSVPSVPTGAPAQRIAGRIPILPSAENEWFSGILINSQSETNPAFAIYQDSDGDIAVKSWSNRYPTDTTDGTPDTMPRANVAASWGDYLLLGDIQWKRNPADTYGSDNTAHYPHGIWRSVAGTSDRWNPDDVFFVGQKLANNAILGMFPVERGLVVVSQSSVSLLRGTPDDFAYEELRNGISPATRDEVAFWAYAGVVVWIDRFGRIWVTDGDTVSRIDRNIEINRIGEGCILGVDQNLLVSGRADVRAFRAMGDEEGAWSTLYTPSGWQKAIQCGSLIIGVGADQDSDGDFVLDTSLLDTGTLNGDLDTVQVFDVDEEVMRGTFNGDPIRPLIRTRPYPGSSDQRVFWHRFGIRGTGEGRLLRASAYPSANIKDRPYEHFPNADFRDRKDWIFPAHGPSLEALFEFELEGDVTVEHLTILAHGGRSER